jgi:hypothetical protein
MEDLTTTTTTPPQSAASTSTATTATARNAFSSWPPLSFQGVNVEQIVNYCEQVEVTPSMSVRMERSMVPVRTNVTGCICVCAFSSRTDKTIPLPKFTIVAHDILLFGLLPHRYSHTSLPGLFPARSYGRINLPWRDCTRSPLVETYVGAR